LPASPFSFNLAGMRGERTAGAVALAIAIALSTSACSGLIEAIEPPPLQSSAPPFPPPPPESIPPQAAMTPQSTTPPQPGQARVEIASWLSKAGYRDFQVAALVQLADTESGFRPCVVGPGGYHYLYQWTGTRLRQLREFAQTSGCPHIRTQLAFTDKELRGERNFSCFWGAGTTPAAYVALRRIFGRGSC
jgi:hypothetical protein